MPSSSQDISHVVACCAFPSRICIAQEHFLSELCISHMSDERTALSKYISVILSLPMAAHLHALEIEGRTRTNNAICSGLC